MKKYVTIISSFLLFFFIQSELFAQRHNRYMRRKQRVADRIEEADRKGKLDPEEKKEIADKKRKLNRTNRRAMRDGEISDREQNRMNRKLRKVKRETRRSEKD
jgi:hypothetical protein